MAHSSHAAAHANKVHAAAHGKKPKLGSGKRFASLKGKLAKKQARLSARRIDHSLTLKSLPSGTNPMGFRTPGSMK